jgi:hypothetical protein
MSGKEKLSLDEFVTAPRRQRTTIHAGRSNADVEPSTDKPDISGLADSEDRGKGKTSSEASKALRQIKRARMKGTSHFVNVNLDRDTKRRLKLASFEMDTSMQAIMEKAIRQFLDANGIE